jgi:hypothetical protein
LAAVIGLVCDQHSTISYQRFDKRLKRAVFCFQTESLSKKIKHLVNNLTESLIQNTTFDK